jgi:hypothetical protein
MANNSGYPGFINKNPYELDFGKFGITFLKAVRAEPVEA